MEELSLDNILETDDIENLFTEYTEETTQEDSAPENNDTKEPKETNETTEVDTDNLFDEQPESVGSGNDDTKAEEDSSPNKDGTSTNNFFSSIAKALKEEGVFPDLNDDVYSNVKDSDSFKELIEQQIQAGLDERQKRIDEALSIGIEPSEITKYENTLSYLDNISEVQLSEENDTAESVRKQLIFQDCINSGKSKEYAQKMVERAIANGTDVEDAKEALRSNKEYFREEYNRLLEYAKEEENQREQLKKEQYEKLKSSILDEKKVFGDLEIDKTTRQKVFDNITKASYKDPDSGRYLTPLQRYEKEHGSELIKNIGLVFTLTDGFKNLDGLVKGKVNKEVKKGLRELEHTLNNTSRTSDGNLNYISGVDDDPNSVIGHGWSLDV